MSDDPSTRLRAGPSTRLRAGVIYFESPAALGEWLAGHHAEAPELWVGFQRKGSGRPSITWPEAVDEALCVGWIDGIRQSVDATSYKIRFTPRRKGSVWSAVNIKRAEELTRLGRMQPAGQAAFGARRDNRSRLYSYENRTQGLAAELEALFREHAEAWAWFQGQPPGYRKTASFWVMDAKREETRQRRLRTLIEESAAGRRIGLLRRPGEG